MTEKKIYYYRIYDDNEQKSYFKCSYNKIEIRKLLKEFEQTHETYFNNDFVKYLQEKDTEAELIELHNLYY